MKKMIALVLAVMLVVPSNFVIAEKVEVIEEETSSISEFLVKYSPEILLNNETFDGEIQLFSADEAGEVQVDAQVEYALERNIPEASSVEIKDELIDDESGSIIQLVSVENSDEDAVLEQLREMEGVEYVEPNYKIKAAYDNLFTQQWGIHPDSEYDINIFEAWNITQGSEDVIVAVIDTGINITHQDLVDNIYTSSDTINYVDSDRNGYEDDIHGWDFTTYVNSTQNGDNSVYDHAEIDKHGTHIAGIIAAPQNHGGIQGVAPKVKILPLKVLGKGGTGTVFHAIKAIEYANAKGVKIANCSWTFEDYSQFLYDAMNQSDMLFVCAAGNSNADLSSYPSYPAAYDLENIISVGSMTSGGVKAETSNYGEGVDLFAPGENIYSTLPGSAYGNMSGTSMAAPFVTGVAALIQTVSPESLAKDIKDRILHTVTKKSGFENYVETGGYLNASAAVLTAVEPSNLPSGRYGAGYITHQNEFYAIGGFDGTNHTNSILKYNPVTKIWDEMALLPYGVSEMALAAYGDNIYIFGGTNESAVDIPLNSVSIYNITTGEITAGADMPGHLSAASFATLDNVAYIFGGLDENGYLSKVYAYDLANNTWSTKQDLSFAFAYGQAIELNGAIYLFGGANAEGCRNEIYKYDPNSDRAVFKATMQVPRKDFTVSAINDKIYIIGGSASFDKAGENRLLHADNRGVVFDALTAVVECYDVYENICEKVDNLDTVAAGVRSITHYGNIYMTGGWNGECLSAVEKYFGPAYPRNIQITSTSSALNIKWSPVNGATGYHVEIDGVVYTTSNLYYLKSVSESQEHTVRIRAVKDGVYSLWSDYQYHYFNSTILDAKELKFDFSVADKLYKEGQIKWYRISMDQAGAVKIALSDVPEDCSYIVQLRNSAGELIASGDTEISDFVLTQGNYYITVTAVIGCSSSQAYALTGSFTASAKSNTLPDRIKAAFTQPASMDDDVHSTGVEMMNIENYEGEDEPEDVIESEIAKPLQKAGGGAMRAEPIFEESMEIADADPTMIMPASITNYTVGTGSLSYQGAVSGGAVTVPAGMPTYTMQKLKVVVRVVPENPNDVFAIQWTSANTQTSNFYWNWHGEPKRYYLTAVLSRSSLIRNFHYNITYEVKSAGSSGKYTIYIYFIEDMNTSEDFNKETGNDGPMIADAIAISNNTSHTMTGKIDHPQDTDFYKISVQANQKLTVVLEAPEGKNYYVSILDHTGNSSSWDPTQFLDGWYRTDSSRAWATIATGIAARDYIIKVDSNDTDFSADEIYTLKIFKYTFNFIGDLEVNDNFAQADSNGTAFVNTFLGGPTKMATTIDFSIDSPVDRDRYAVTLNAGDKMSVMMSMPSTYKDDTYEYRIAICSDVNKTDNGVSWRERCYNNPNSTQSKFATFIAPKTGTYYISVQSETGEYHAGISGALTITKTPAASLDKYENKGNECSNDFIFTTIFEIFGTHVGVDGCEDLTGSLSASLDNELDVDWYRYTNGASAKKMLISLSGNDAMMDSGGIVVLDGNYNIISDGTAGYIYPLAKNEIIYIGVYAKDGKYDAIKNERAYTVSVEIPPEFGGSISNLSYNEGTGAKFGKGNQLSFTLSYSGITDLPYRVVVSMTWGNNPEWYPKKEETLYLTGSSHTFLFKDITIFGANEDILKTRVEVYLGGGSVFISEATEQSVTESMPATLKFRKSTDSSFIYVNNPEYIANRDIVDDVKTEIYGKRKIFEQQNITGKNTYYEPHLAWWGTWGEEYFPAGDFYFDVDFYNPTDKDISIDISNLAYLSENVQNSYGDAQNYLNGQGMNQSFTLQSGEHKLLFKDILEDSYKIVDGNSELEGWERAKGFFVLFDFVVQSGNITISSLAAYDEENLRLANDSSNTLVSGWELNHGDIIYQDRPNEGDIEQKYKGIARGQSAWIEAEVDVVIDGKSNVPLNLYEPLYQGIVEDNTKNTWKTNLNPVNDSTDGLHLAIPSNLHAFEYRYSNERKWSFDFKHSDLNINCLNLNGTAEESVNMELDNCLNMLAEKVRSGTENTTALFPDSLGMSSWGATYHYTISATNICNEDKVIEYDIANSSQVIIGYRLQGETAYTTEYAPERGNEEWYPVKSVTIPARQTVTFEIVTLLACGDGGLHNRLIVK